MHNLYLGVFFSELMFAESEWEIKISRVPITVDAVPGDADPDNAVTCMGTGAYNVTNTGSITCS